MLFGRFVIVRRKFIRIENERCPSFSGWLFLCFRREFANEEDTLICFEVVCSHFLEENSLAAERLLHDIQLEMAEEKGISRISSIQTETFNDLEQPLIYSFDLFVCVAMICLFRSCLFNAEDELEALEGIQKRQKTLDVRQVLSLAEEFFKIFYEKTAQTVAPSPSTSPYDIID